MSDIADTRTPSVIGTGERIICHGRYETIERIIAHPPRLHPHAGPVRGDWWAVEIVTAVGSRWFGSETQPYIGSDLRMHWGPEDPE